MKQKYICVRFAQSMLDRIDALRFGARAEWIRTACSEKIQRIEAERSNAEQESAKTAALQRIGQWTEGTGA